MATGEPAATDLEIRSVIPILRMFDVDPLHAELRGRQYPFLNPGVEPGPGGGREMVLIDPASNCLRFYEPADS